MKGVREKKREFRRIVGTKRIQRRPVGMTG